MVCPNMPRAAQNFPSTSAELLSDTGIDLRLHQCDFCGLVQFGCETVSYYREVIRAGGETSTMRELRQQQYGEFIESCDLYGKKILEVGCGCGEFLEFLKPFNVVPYGIEHKVESVMKAQALGLNVRQGYIDSEACTVDDAPFDAFLSFNFLEHQPDPNGMLKGIFRNLTAEGCGLITVPSFEYIIENHGFYELIRDHLAYFTKETFTFVLNQNGFEIAELKIVNGDTWAAIVRKRRPTDIGQMKENFARLSTTLNRYVDSYCESGKKVAVWGASHQGLTAIATSGVGPKISYIIDSAVFKQNKFAPASHVKICSPKHFFVEPVDAIIIMAPGYTNEISNLIRREFGTAVDIAVLKSKTLEKLEI